MNAPTQVSGLRVTDLSKTFGSTIALGGVSVDFLPGEVHGLLGANGAGKSTLIACLGGAEKADSGSIELAGSTYASFTPRGAIEAGIAIIYQHFQVVDDLTVADNIFLGSEATRPPGFIKRALQERESSEILSRLGVDISPRALVGSLSVGERQVVEIARALRRNPSVLILDEPTAALSKVEAEALLALVRKLAEQLRIVVIYVTHLLGEIMQVADRVTMMRGGAVMWTKPKGEFDLDDLISGISPDAQHASRGEARAFGETIVEFDDFRTSYVGPVSLHVRAGEIVGVFGLLGSGRTNFLETLAGARPNWSGHVTVAGRGARLSTPKLARGSGIALVASDRVHQSLFGEMPAMENAFLPHYRAIARPLRSFRREKELFALLAAKIGLTPPDPQKPANVFSGGNAQKLVVGRWIGSLGDTRLLLLDEPTQGVDIGSRQQIYALLREFAQSTQSAVIFASSDPDEVVALADRALVLHEGTPVAVVDPLIGEEALLEHAHRVDPAVRIEKK